MSKPETITLTKKEVRHLILEIADRCESAYRRGAQQALAFGLTKPAASWCRYYGRKAYADGKIRYAQAHPTPNNSQKTTTAPKVPLTRSIEALSGPIRDLAYFAGVEL
jgi:hypothetical protein